ncbi:MAG: 50S ribosomal protein L6 [Vampirovibrionales bacterium]|nr:50S ribosomal protein L6 [Vampirovibrionales bacterium]
MSRIGKAPIEIPDKVDVVVDGQTVRVKGPLGELSWTFRSEVAIEREGNTLQVVRSEETRQARSLHGLSRTLLSNMVVGVSQGFERRLEIVGVGYRAQVQGNKLTLALGYSHPVEFEFPKHMQVAVEANTKVSIKGPDKQEVGDFAAAVRAKRPPEPYKGKGVRYAGEMVRRKAGKSGKK